MLIISPAFEGYATAQPFLLVIEGIGNDQRCPLIAFPVRLFIQAGARSLADEE